MQLISQIYTPDLRASGQGAVEIAARLRDDIAPLCFAQEWWVFLSIAISIIISLLALLATFYQLHLQRVHNEKSLKPLGQIDLPDHKKQIAVHIRNNGLGPLIIDRLTFIKGEHTFSSIKDCLDLDPRSYMHISVDDSVKRVVLPNSHLTVFEKNFRDHADEADRDRIRNQLAPLKLKVHCRDIYDNKFIVERDFQWFSRYSLENTVKL